MAVNLKTSEKFCIKCGHPTAHRSPDDTCVHLYRAPSEFLIPCSKLYGDVDWCIWTIDDSSKAVFVDTPEFNGTMNQVGTGGIVLRKPQLIVKSWPLSDTVNLMTYLSQQYGMEEDMRTQIFIILQSFQDILIAAETAWPYPEITFRKNDGCAGLRLSQIPFLEFVNEMGPIDFTGLLNDIILHGQWDAKYPIQQVMSE